MLAHQAVTGVSDSPVCFFDSPGLYPDYSQVEHLGCVVQTCQLWSEKVPRLTIFRVTQMVRSNQAETELGTARSLVAISFTYNSG